MSNFFLGSGTEAKQRPFLGAGDTTTSGANITGGGGGGLAAIAAQVLSVVSGGVLGGGLLGDISGLHPRNPTTDPGIIER